MRIKRKHALPLLALCVAPSFMQVFGQEIRLAPHIHQSEQAGELPGSLACPYHITGDYRP